MNGGVTHRGFSSWIPVPEGSDFPVQNLPFGIMRTAVLTPRAATRVGDAVIDLYTLAQRGYFSGLSIDPEAFGRVSLNEFIRLGRPVWREVRERLSRLLGAEDPALRDHTGDREAILHPVEEVEMMLPVEAGDYTDFYSSIEHATHVGMMFRDPDHALLPNWRHIPVGYHGRSSSIVVSGTPVHRPKGQTQSAPGKAPEFGPSQQLDFELEVAFITGKKSELGSPIPVEEAEEYIFGLLLFNDLSARDIQKWEYVPLGPFLGKNFGSVVSPWVVTLDALEPFRTRGPVQEPPVLPYLQIAGRRNLDLQLSVLIQPEGGPAYPVCHTNFRHMYWNMAQQLAHHTVNGCNVNVGDIYASGTVSGPSPGSYGSLLELAWQGTRPVRLPDGTSRSFLHDFDTVILRGHGERDGLRIGFGEVSTQILPAKP